MNKENHNALWLVAEGDYVHLKIEAEKGKWLTIVTERLDSAFSHIIEPAGIDRILTENQ